MSENAILNEAQKSQLYKMGLDAEVPVLALPEGFAAQPVTPFLKDFLLLQPAPRRRSGTYTAASVDSLIAWLKENAGEDAPVFGAGLEKLGANWRQPNLSLIGIGNYSKGQNAAWHDFRCRYDFPVSRQWMVWAGHSCDEEKENWFSQAAFAEFIEEHVYEVYERKPEDQVNAAITRFLQATEGAAFATVSDLLRLSREFKVRVDSETEVAFDPTTGARVMRYNETHKGAGGRDVRIPSMFFIRIPVFFGQPEVLMGVKLRYRTVQGVVAWSYSLFAPDLTVADEFQKAFEQVREAGFPVYLGSPDFPNL